MTRRDAVFYSAFGLAAIVMTDAALDPQIIFIASIANVVTIELTMLMPMVMAIAGWPGFHANPPRILRIGLYLIGVFGVALATLFAIGLLAFGLSAPPTLWSTGTYTLAIYDQSGSEFDKGLYQACRIVPGVLITQRLREFSGDPESRIAIIDSTHIRVYDDAFMLKPILWPGC